jgi:hypothetical protein
MGDQCAPQRRQCDEKCSQLTLFLPISEALWGKVRSKVLMRLKRIANAGIASVRSAFGLRAADVFFSDDLPQMRREMIGLADQVLVPARARVERMDQNDWRILALKLKGTVQEVDRILSLFSRNLDVEYTSGAAGDTRGCNDDTQRILHLAGYAGSTGTVSRPEKGRFIFSTASATDNHRNLW